MIAAHGTPDWHGLGDVAELRTTPLRQRAIGRTKIALSLAFEMIERMNCIQNQTSLSSNEGKDVRQSDASLGRIF